MAERNEIERREVCARFGLTHRALHHYEALELLAPRRCAGKAYYGPREIARIKLIQRGKRFLMSLEEIRQWMNLYDGIGEAGQLRDWLRIATEKEQVLRQNIAIMNAALAELDRLRQVADEALSNSVTRQG